MKYRTCNVCGARTNMALGGCTNGRCDKCHAKYCTPGGITGPGHGMGNPPKPKGQA